MLSIIILLSCAIVNASLYWGTGTTEDLQMDFTPQSKARPESVFLMEGAVSNSSNGISFDVKETPESRIESQFYIKNGAALFTAKMASGNTMTTASLYTSSSGMAISVAGGHKSIIVTTLNSSLDHGNFFDTQLDLTNEIHTFGFSWYNETISYIFDGEIIQTLDIKDVPKQFLHEPAKISFETQSLDNSTSKSDPSILVAVTMVDKTGAWWYDTVDNVEYHKGRNYYYNNKFLGTNNLNMSSYIINEDQN